MGLWRRLTDRMVYCRKCGEPIGYVPLFPLFRNTRWEHVDCPPYAPVRAV